MRLQTTLATAIALLPFVATAQQRWTDDDGMIAFFQAVREISARSIQPASVEVITQAALNAYLADTDPYGRYLHPAEYAQIKDTTVSSYGGVGMEIAQSASGALRCLPYPESPAALAGVMEGDVLLNVDGMAVTATDPLALIGARIRGPIDSDVRIGLRREGQEPFELTLTRATVLARTVLPGATNTWRILVFDAGTAAELRLALGRSTAEETVVLDMRGNPGGSLAGAIECARLFLEKDKAIVELRTRSTSIRNTGRDNAPFLEAPGLVLWQDRNTASAAEVFIAALTQNQRAVSIGETTFGKGVTQRTTELINGGALILTDGWLFPPNGKAYHGIGIPPTIAIDATSTEAFRRATKRMK